MTALTWGPDVLDGFEQATLTMPRSWDGDVEVAVVRRATSLTTGAAVLYVHGFVDYFFQAHLADFYEAQGIRFYAVDLRRHGRALRPHQQPNVTRDIDEYLADVDAVVEVLCRDEGVDWLLLNGHSTGGLVAAVHAHRGAQRANVHAVFLNSPFLDMNMPAWQERFLEPVLAAVGRLLPSLKLAGLSPLYAESVHDDHRGEWSFDLAWKPIAGFPPRAGWLRAIHRAQAEVDRGLRIEQPVLLLHSARSAHPKQWSDDVTSTDIVLDVADMHRLVPNLGPYVEEHAVPGGLHDLVLSAQPVREAAFTLLASWLAGVRA